MANSVMDLASLYEINNKNYSESELIMIWSQIREGLSLYVLSIIWFFRKYFVKIDAHKMLVVFYVIAWFCWHLYIFKVCLNKRINMEDMSILTGLIFEVSFMDTNKNYYIDFFWLMTKKINYEGTIEVWLLDIHCYRI